MSASEPNLNGFGTALAKINEPGFSLKAIIGGRATREKAVIDVIKLGIEQRTFTEIRGINAKFNEEGFSKNLLSVLKDKSILVNQTGVRNRWALSEPIVSFITASDDQPVFRPEGRKAEDRPEDSFEPNLQGKFKDLWEFLVNHPERELDLLLLTQDMVEEAAVQFEVEKQFVWDTIRKLENQSLLKRAGRKDSGIVIEFKSSFGKITPPRQDSVEDILQPVELIEEVQSRSDGRITEPAAPPAQELPSPSPPVAQRQPFSEKGNITLAELRSNLEREIAGIEKNIHAKESNIRSLRDELDNMQTAHDEKVEFLRKIEEYCR